MFGCGWIRTQFALEDVIEVSDHPDRLSQPAENPIPDQAVLKQELARTDRDFVTRLEEWREQHRSDAQDLTFAAVSGAA